MLKKLFFLCAYTTSMLLGTNGNTQRIVNDYEERHSKLARELDKENIWRLLKQDPKKADKLAIQTLFNFYSADVMYGNMEGEELFHAWEEIKQERLEEERKIQEKAKEDLHPIEPLRTIKRPSKPKKTRKKEEEEEKPLREKIMHQEQQKTTRKNLGQAE